MKLIVGLGNPGRKYQRTRHNAGFNVMDKLADGWNVQMKKSAMFSSMLGTYVSRTHRTHGTRTCGHHAHSDTLTHTSHRSRRVSTPLNASTILISKPLTYMNLSGVAVEKIIRMYKIGLSEILIVYDDTALPLGKLRLKPGGSSGGHNGLESIIMALGSGEFPRLRLGIGPVPANTDPKEFVLSEFSEMEKEAVGMMTVGAADAIEEILRVGLARAMETINPADARVVTRSHCE